MQYNQSNTQLGIYTHIYSSDAEHIITPSGHRLDLNKNTTLSNALKIDKNATILDYRLLTQFSQVIEAIKLLDSVNTTLAVKYHQIPCTPDDAKSFLQECKNHDIKKIQILSCYDEESLNNLQTAAKEHDITVKGVAESKSAMIIQDNGEEYLVPLEKTTTTDGNNTEDNSSNEDSDNDYRNEGGETEDISPTPAEKSSAHNQNKANNHTMNRSAITAGSYKGQKFKKYENIIHPQYATNLGYNKLVIERELSEAQLKAQRITEYRKKHDHQNWRLDNAVLQSILKSFMLSPVINTSIKITSKAEDFNKLETARQFMQKTPLRSLLTQGIKERSVLFAVNDCLTQNGYKGYQRAAMLASLEMLFLAPLEVKEMAKDALASKSTFEILNSPQYRSAAPFLWGRNFISSFLLNGGYIGEHDTRQQILVKALLAGAMQATYQNVVRYSVQNNITIQQFNSQHAENIIRFLKKNRIGVLFGGAARGAVVITASQTGDWLKQKIRPFDSGHNTSSDGYTPHS